MCSATRCFLVAATLLLPHDLAGQRTAELQTRADSLLREWRQANVFAAVQDSLRQAVRGTGRDTTRVGALTILANPSPLPLAQAAAHAWPVIAGFYGSTAQVLARRPVLILAVDPDTASPTPNPGEGLRIPWNTNRNELSRILVTAADLSDLDRRLHDWLGGGITPFLEAPGRRAATYLQLVTAPSRAVRSCYEGNLTACRDALSLSDAPDLLTRWYGPDERRFLATTQFFLTFHRGPRAPELASCAAGSDAACLDLLESLPPGSVRPPLDHDARHTVLETAIVLGGPETFSRLLATASGLMGPRLAAAAGVTEDSLLARWRADILAAPPKPVALPPWGGLIALAWTGVFLACALGSSRWRVS